MIKDDRFYLQTILDMIARIDRATSDGETLFLSSDLHQDAVLRNLHTITETTQRLSDDLKNSHDEIEWRKLSAFRNVVVHDYLGIDIGLIWSIVVNDIPALEQQIKEILNNL